MNRFVPLVGCAVLVVACSGDRAGGERVTLRFAPTPGTTRHYVIEQHTKMRFEGGPMAQLGEQQMTFRVFVTEAIAGPASGGTAVALTFDSTHAESPALPVGRMEEALRRMRGLTGQLVLDERMRVIDATFKPAPGLPAKVGEQLGSIVQGMAFPFPARPVGVGDSWTEAVALPLGELPGSPGPVRASTSLRLREIHRDAADTTVVFEIVSAMPKDPIHLRINGQDATIHLAGTLEGEQEFSLTHSMPLTAAMTGVIRMTTSDPITGGQATTLNLDQRVVMRTVGGS